ncbi:MAG: mismatch-specific DNA-glycosylase [Dehalococcoidia bacterium]
MRTLPDLLRPGLALVFVGINPGERSARARHYYAHPGNAFWRELSASGLITEPVLRPLDDRRLLEAGIGFTDVVKRVVTDSSKVLNAELAAAVPAFRARIGYAAPRAVCFTSTRALEAVVPRTRAAGTWGRQQATIEGAAVWLIPSTSGRAAAYRNEIGRVLGELALELGRAAVQRNAA